MVWQQRKGNGSSHAVNRECRRIKQEQDENVGIYKKFMTEKETGNMDMAHSAAEMLAENYKTMFALDNARNILLDLAKEYLQGEKLAEATDNQFGKGCAEYVAHANFSWYRFRLDLQNF